MRYEFENHNPETVATIHTYSVDFMPYNLRHLGKVFPNRRDAIRYALSIPDPQDGTRCKILVCSFAYRVYYGDLECHYMEYPNKRDALRFARQQRKEHPGEAVSVGYYDVTVANDVCELYCPSIPDKFQ